MNTIVAVPDAHVPDLSNSAGNPEATREDFEQRIAAFLAGLDVWDTRPTLDADTAQRARDFIAGAKKLAKEADEARVIEKAPYLEGTKRVDGAWKVITTKIDKVLAGIEPKLAAFIRAERDRQAEEKRQAAEREAKAARELAAAEEAAKLAATSSERIEAEAVADAAKADMKQAIRVQAAPAARVGSATGLAPRAATLRKVWRAELTEPMRTLGHYKDHPELLDLLSALAIRDFRDAPTVGGEKQVPTIPGVTFAFDEVLAA